MAKGLAANCKFKIIQIVVASGIIKHLGFIDFEFNVINACYSRCLVGSWHDLLFSVRSYYYVTENIGKAKLLFRFFFMSTLLTMNLRSFMFLKLRRKF